MAESKSPLRKGERIEQGIVTEDKGKFIPISEREPYDPENLHLSKADFIAKQKARKEKALKMAEYARQYDEEARGKREAKEAEIDAEQKRPALAEPTPEVKKKKGRPKKS